jgi:hypothetical protein
MLVVRSIVILMIALSLFGATTALKPWVYAAGVRDTIVRAASEDPRLRACEVANVRFVPVPR